LSWYIAASACLSTLSASLSSPATTWKPTLALHYPTAMYFFVSKQRPELAADIRKGLDIALRDGSFEALFLQNFGEVLKRSRLDKRRVFELKNPLLPPETPLGDARLWYRPGR
jgi:hypothetical protein